MDFDKLYPGRFLKAVDLDGKDLTLTISAVHLDELEGNRGKQTKGLVSFSDQPKALVLNRTNGLCLKAMFGRETDAWVGKRITLYPAPIQFEDADICIRVRGSPDILQDVTFELKLARKRPRQVTLQRTGPKPAANGRPPAPPTIFEQMEIACDEYGVPRAHLRPMIKGLNLKATTPKDLTPEDLTLVRAELAKLKAPTPAPPASDDVPF